MRNKKSMQALAKMVTDDELMKAGTRHAHIEIKKKYGIDITDLLVEMNHLKLTIRAYDKHMESYEDLIEQILQSKE
jgi:hypothetical protein